MVANLESGVEVFGLVFKIQSQTVIITADLLLKRETDVTE